MKHLFGLLFTINGAAAQSADAVFYMEMDTLGGGIRAGQEYDLVPGIELLKKLQYFGFILGGTVIVGQLQCAYKVMPYTLQLFRGRGGRTDFQIGIKLS